MRRQRSAHWAWIVYKTLTKSFSIWEKPSQGAFQLNFSTSEKLRAKSIFRRKRKKQEKGKSYLDCLLLYTHFFSSLSSAISIKWPVHFQGNWRIRQTRRARETKVVWAEGIWREKKEKQTENQEWKTDCIDKNDYYKPRGMVKNTVLSARRYGSNDKVWKRELMGILPHTKKASGSRQMKVCVWSLWWPSGRGSTVALHMDYTFLTCNDKWKAFVKKHHPIPNTPKTQINAYLWNRRF